MGVRPSHQPLIIVTPNTVLQMVRFLILSRRFSCDPLFCRKPFRDCHLVNQSTVFSLRELRSARVCFLSGVICVFGRRELKAAESAFGRSQGVAALNDLALVKLRLKKNNEVVETWRKALSLLPRGSRWPTELSQNICRLDRLATIGGCRLAPSARKTLLDLQASLPVQARTAYDPHVGWLYMPFDPKEENPWIIPDKFIGGEDNEHGRRIGEDRLCMNCDGRGTIKCPNKQCKGGKVPAGNRMSAAGTDHASGRSFGFVTPVFANCPLCGGLATLPCPCCWKGIEIDLLTRDEVEAFRAERGIRPAGQYQRRQKSQDDQRPGR